MEFAEKRRRYKQLIWIKFNELLSSQKIQKLIQSLFLTQYEFIIAEKQHLNEATELLVSEYMKHNPIHTAFNISQEMSRQMLYSATKPKIEAGRFFIAIDKTSNKIVATIACSDFYDSGSFNSVLKDSLTQKQKHIAEILALSAYHDKLQEIAGNEYGKLFVPSAQCKTSSMKTRPFLSMFILFLATSTMISCGYNMFYGELTHQQATKQNAVLKPRILHECDYSNHIFKDGTHISCYWNELKENRNCSKDMIEKLKANCKIYIVLYTKKQYRFAKYIADSIMTKGTDTQWKKRKLSKL